MVFGTISSVAMTWILIFNGRSTMCAFAKIPFITFLYLESPAFRNHYPLFDILELNNKVLSLLSSKTTAFFAHYWGLNVRTAYVRTSLIAYGYLPREIFPCCFKHLLWSSFDACPNCHARESHSCKVPHKLWELRFWELRQGCDGELFMAHCYFDIFRHSFHA